MWFRIDYLNEKEIRTEKWIMRDNYLSLLRYAAVIEKLYGPIVGIYFPTQQIYLWRSWQQYLNIQANKEQEIV